MIPKCFVVHGTLIVFLSIANLCMFNHTSLNDQALSTPRLRLFYSSISSFYGSVPMFNSAGSISSANAMDTDWMVDFPVLPSSCYFCFCFHFLLELHVPGCVCVWSVSRCLFSEFATLQVFSTLVTLALFQDLCVDVCVSSCFSFDWRLYRTRHSYKKLYLCASACASLTHTSLSSVYHKCHTEWVF